MNANRASLERPRALQDKDRLPKTPPPDLMNRRETAHRRAMAVLGLRRIQRGDGGRGLQIDLLLGL